MYNFIVLKIVIFFSMEKATIKNDILKELINNNLNDYD